MAATKREVISLYRAILRSSSQYENYGFRTLSRRKVITSFRDHKDLSPEDAAVQYVKGKEQLDVLKRQVAVSKLFPEQSLSVMEMKS